MLATGRAGQASLSSRDLAELLEAAASSLDRPRDPVPAETLRVGVDLGTAMTVLVVIDGADRPVLTLAHPSGALRDGVVVDFIGAAEVVANLRVRAERMLDRPLTRAATAHPPGVPESDRRTCGFVVERAGFDTVELCDEIQAAQQVLEVEDGILVDVGGGSTGVGVLVDGELVHVDDRPGGGHHLDLILAGALSISTEEAERRKREEGARHLPIIRPGIERIATQVQRMSTGWGHLPVHVAGGALQVPGAADLVADMLGVPVHLHPHTELVTPLGIAHLAPCPRPMTPEPMPPSATAGTRRA